MSFLPLTIRHFSRGRDCELQDLSCISVKLLIIYDTPEVGTRALRLMDHSLLDVGSAVELQFSLWPVADLNEPLHQSAIQGDLRACEALVIATATAELTPHLQRWLEACRTSPQVEAKPVFLLLGAGKPRHVSLGNLTQPPAIRSNPHARASHREVSPVELHAA